jgi:hypothetical protein
MHDAAIGITHADHDPHIGRPHIDHHTIAVERVDERITNPPPDATRVPVRHHRPVRRRGRRPNATQPTLFSTKRTVFRLVSTFCSAVSVILAGEDGAPRLIQRTAARLFREPDARQHGHAI